ncbi:hypothetical protein TPMD03_38 [Thiohalocapsa phage LS06-2018-MD03]|nr:hypothetical protein TPMD03_38 [Thiohalocapsa phage LS06-2018-MD03]
MTINEMKRFIAPQITIDHLLSVEVDEEVSFIIPIDNIVECPVCHNGNISNNLKCDSLYCKSKMSKVFCKRLSPLQQQDEFFIAEEYCECGINAVINNSTGLCIKCSKKYDKPWTTSQMTPEQSRFHGVVVDVKVEKIMSLKGFIYHKVVSQHNEIHNTNIEPSLDDYVSYLTVRRLI